MEKRNPELYFPELSPIENDLLFRNYTVEDGEEILIINIDIGDGRKEKIRIFEYDDSDQIALDFCHKYMLGARAKMLLANEIEKHLKVALSRSRETESLHSPKITQGSIGEKDQDSIRKSSRNKTFTQKSMQVKRYLTRQRTVVNPQVRNSSNGSNSNFSTAQETLDSPLLKNQRSSRSVKAKTRNTFRQSPETQNKNLNKSTYQVRSSAGQKSERIMNKIKYQRYKEIFNMLLPDSKGLISKETIYKSSMSQNLKKIISPLLEELQELNETLEFNEFYDAMEMLMRVLSPGEKSILLLPSKPKTIVKEEYEFKPKINPGQLTSSTLGLYERGIQKKQEISRKLEKGREIKAEAEMKECKFSPNIKNSHRKVQSSSVHSNSTQKS
jgi:hypothetical protein